MKQLPENYKTRKLLAKLEQLGAIIEFEPQEEDVQVDDQIEGEKYINKIIEDYNNGNIYAWFCAKVTVKYKGYEATDYLGCCSYKSEKDFKDNSGYYLDMVQTCVSEINEQVRAYNNNICKRFEIRKAKNILSKYGYVAAMAI